MDAEVQKLLGLKGQYKAITGEELAGAGAKKGGKDDKKDKKENKKTAKESKKAKSDQKDGSGDKEDGKREVKKVTRWVFFKIGCLAFWVEKKTCHKLSLLFRLFRKWGSWWPRGQNVWFILCVECVQPLVRSGCNTCTFKMKKIKHHPDYFPLHCKAL